jgi:hypothetical protein
MTMIRREESAEKPTSYEPPTLVVIARIEEVTLSTSGPVSDGHVNLNKPK